MIIQKNLSHKLIDAQIVNGNLRSRNYHLIGSDLRYLTRNLLLELGMDDSMPTLVISECCLIYLQVEQSNALIREMNGFFKNCGFIVYEQIGPHDAFGKMMIRNLTEREITLFGIYEYPTLEAQKERWQSLGFSQVQGWNMLDALKEFISQSTIDLWDSKERLDEVEEWILFCRHYFILFAEK
jgi:O-methyltransferase involved in polyketide biosynthesis